MRAVVFLGPTLPVAEARRILDATYLPPVRQSDLVSAVGIHRPDVIAIVDGEFRHTLSVWHKEILFALERGIAVYGASSMGALRAAECDAFGMVGVGEVYRQYADGTIVDDDEVALAHALDEDGYRPLSEPMVNLRATFAAARAAGVVRQAEHDTLVRVAKARFFAERTLPAILRDAGAAGVAEATLEGLRRFLGTGYVDQKRLDAIRLLEMLRDRPEPGPAPVPCRVERTSQFLSLYERDRRVRHDGVEVPLAAIASHAALHDPDFNEINDAALGRELVAILADLLEVSPTEEEVAEETRRFRLRRRLRTDAALEEWQARNDLFPEEFERLMAQRATTRVMEQWLVTRTGWMRPTRFLLDELRLRGRYEQAAAAAAGLARTCQEYFPHFDQTGTDPAPTEALVIRHLRATRCAMDTHYSRWSEEAGFPRLLDLRNELIRSQRVRERVESLALEVLAGDPAAAAAPA